MRLDFWENWGYVLLWRAHFFLIRKRSFPASFFFLFRLSHHFIYSWEKLLYIYCVEDNVLFLRRVKKNCRQTAAVPPPPSINSRLSHGEWASAHNISIYYLPTHCWWSWSSKRFRIIFRPTNGMYTGMLLLRRCEVNLYKRTHPTKYIHIQQIVERVRSYARLVALIWHTYVYLCMCILVNAYI